MNESIFNAKEKKIEKDIFEQKKGKIQSSESSNFCDFRIKFELFKDNGKTKKFNKVV